MYCPKCFLTLRHDKVPDIDECTLCGTRLLISVQDVLEFGMFGLTKEVRPTQVLMAQELELLLQSKKGTVLLEGGTGIGKSFTYILPIILSGGGTRAVISTAKKTLQDQLALKDLPLIIRKVMGEKQDISKVFTLYKGKSNYACWRMESSVPVKDRKKYKAFIAHAQTLQQPADIASWKGPIPLWWSDVTIEHCALGAECPDNSLCKPHPERVPIVVTNHHLTAIDTMLCPGTLFGDYSCLIFDEAHQVPEAFRAAREFKATSRGVKRLRTYFNNAAPLCEAVDASQQATVQGISDTLLELSQKFNQLHAKALETITDSGMLDPTQIKKPLQELSDFTANLLNKFSRISGTITTERKQLAEGQEIRFSDDMSIGQLTAALNSARRLTSQIKGIQQIAQELLDLPKQENTNLVAVASEKGISIKPIETGELIGPQLTAKHVAFLSATLAMGKNFQYARANFGIDPTEGHYRELIFPSPFDYSIKHALLYIPRHLPVPAHAGMGQKRRDWLSAIAQEITRLVLTTEGNAFVLCTARTDMNDILDAIPSTFWESNGLHAVAQEGPASATLTEYLTKPGGVLFGLKSFWEGVDVPGDKLRMVIVPKLPFPFFKDPLIGAQCAQVEARGGSPFFEVQIPLMTFDMKQGLGRLIRTTGDRGIAAILDPRIWTASSKEDMHLKRIKLIEGDMPRYAGKRIGYGRELLNALPFLAPTHDFQTVVKAAKHYFKRKP